MSRNRTAREILLFVLWIVIAVTVAGGVQQLAELYPTVVIFIFSMLVGWKVADLVERVIRS